MEQTTYVVEWDKGTARFPTDDEARRFQKRQQPDRIKQIRRTDRRARLARASRPAHNPKGRAYQRGLFAFQQPTPPGGPPPRGTTLCRNAL